MKLKNAWKLNKVALSFGKFLFICCWLNFMCIFDMAVWVGWVCICMFSPVAVKQQTFFFFFFLRQVNACQPWVSPVCFSFKSKMCFANLTDDLSLVGSASYLAPLGSKSIAQLSCCAGTGRSRTEVPHGVWEIKVPLMHLPVPPVEW